MITNILVILALIFGILGFYLEFKHYKAIQKAKKTLHEITPKILNLTYHIEQQPKHLDLVSVANTLEDIYFDLSDTIRLLE